MNSTSFKCEKCNTELCREELPEHLEECFSGWFKYNISLIQTIEIPDDVVELVIGPERQQLSVIQSTSGCNAHIADESKNGMRLCTLTGSRWAINEFKEDVKAIILKTRFRIRDSSQVFSSKTLTIPGNKCGLIAGKHGETIKSIQDILDVKLSLTQESNISDGSLIVSGDATKVKEAARKISEVVNAKILSQSMHLTEEDLNDLKNDVGVLQMELGGVKVLVLVQVKSFVNGFQFNMIGENSVVNKYLALRNAVQAARPVGHYGLDSMHDLVEEQKTDVGSQSDNEGKNLKE